MTETLIYRLTVTVLTPVHIRADQVPLQAGWDFVVQEGRVWRLDLDRLYQDLWPGAAELPTPAALLRGRSAAAYARYAVALPVAGEPAQIWATTRDPLSGQPYLPGSSLKGVLRTALLWSLYSGPLPRLTAAQAREAARDLEQMFFGPNPNHNLGRAILPADLQPVGSVECWAVACELHSLEGSGRLVPRAALDTLEVIAPGSRFQGRLTLDRRLLTASGLRLPAAGVQAAADLPGAVRAFGQALHQAEVRFYRDHSQPAVAALLAGFDAGAGAILCLGWGGGWRSKTIGLKLQPEEIARVQAQYGLHRWRGQHFPTVFPASRRLVRTARGLQPLGWVHITFAEDR